METYAYIDGGYLRDCFTRGMNELFNDRPQIDFDLLRDKIYSDRVFYYECLTEDDSEAPSSAPVVKEFLDRVKRADFYHVRLGTIRGKKKRTQKELDVLLAVDMLTDAFYKNMKNAVLFSGDLDFRPALESLIRLGVRVSLFYDPQNAAEELILAADVREPCGKLWMHSVMDSDFKHRNRLPTEVSMSKMPECFKWGTCGGIQVGQFKSGEDWVVIFEQSSKNVRGLAHRDIEFLTDRYLPQMENKVIQWD